MFIVIIDHENICIDTDFMALPFLVFKILSKVWFLVMAVQISIFGEMHQRCQEGII